jgi:predicted small metal-binding protein
VARGETIEELNAEIAKHAKEVHGLSDEELSDPKMVEMIKSLIKDE